MQFPNRTLLKKIHSMGLAMMYRLPFDNRIPDLLPESHRTEKHDLADQIFGVIGEHSLKGRVQFSHAFAEQAEAVEHPVTTVLGGPKASYTPNYLQEGGSYRNANSRLKGWKRYPVHPSNNGIRYNPGADNVSTTFTPLKAGAKFLCKIRFHNLRKAELGALLSALSFHGHEEELFHSLGMAKPLGCGKMKLEIEDVKSQHLNMENRDEYLNSFVDYLEKEVNTTNPEFNWRGQAQIEELLTMAKEQNNRANSSLEYMTLEMQGPNEFADAKAAGEHLRKYSELDGIQKVTLLTVADFVNSITTALENADIQAVQAMPRNDKFKQGLVKALVAQKHKSSWNNLYNMVRLFPEIILIQAPSLGDNELKERISKIDVPDKSNPTIQDLFDYLLENDKVNHATPPEWALPVAYGWEDLNLTDDQLLNEMDNLGQRLWPTVESLKTYLENHKFADITVKELCLEMIIEYLNDN